MSFLRSAVVCVAAVSFTSFLLTAQVKNEPTVVKIDSRVFDRYVGAYVLGRQYSTVFRKGDHYYAQITGQEPFEMFPQSDHEFFMKAVDAQLIFNAEANGKTYKLTLRQGGPPQWAPSAPLSERETKLVVEQQKAVDDVIGAARPMARFLDWSGVFFGVLVLFSNCAAFNVSKEKEQTAVKAKQARQASTANAGSASMAASSSGD